MGNRSALSPQLSAASHAKRSSLVHALPYSLHLFIYDEVRALVIRTLHKHLSNTVAVEVEHSNQAPLLRVLFAALEVPGHRALILTILLLGNQKESLRRQILLPERKAANQLSLPITIEVYRRDVVNLRFGDDRRS